MTAPDQLTATASSPDGSVRVEVGIGGGLRSVLLTDAALAGGAANLARTVLSVAERARAKANQRAGFLLGRELGDAAGPALDQLGLSAQAELLDDLDEDTGERGVLR
jgi:hypothetical protein